MMRAWQPLLSHFAHPEALYLFAAFPLLWAAAIIGHFRRQKALALLGSRPALRSLTAVGRWRRTFLSFCVSTAFTFLVLAIAGPQWGYDPEPALASGRDLVVVLDASRSMLAEDMLPNRLRWAQQALLDLAAEVRRRGGHRLGLVVFAGRARIVCPLTPDYDHFREVVAALDPADPRLAPVPGADAPASGTRIGQALVQAVQLHEPRFRDFQDILLLSDGDDPANDDEWKAGVQAARAAGIPVHTVGVGNPEADSPVRDEHGRSITFEGRPVLTRLEDKPLEEIARSTGGVYVRAWEERQPLARWFQVWTQARPDRDLGEEPLPALEPRYPLFLAPALALFALGTLVTDRPWSRSRGGRRPAYYAAALALLLVSASLPSDAERWLRLGNAAFERGAYAEAAGFYERAEETTTDPGLVALNQAAALYRLGRFRDAELHYLRALEDAAGERRGRAFFDLGNALVQESQGIDAGMIDRAIASYESCLREPLTLGELRDDVEFNLQVARDLRQRAKSAKKETAADSQRKAPEDEATQQRPPRRGAESADGSDPHGEMQRGAAGEPGKDGEAQASQQRQPGTGNLPPVPDSDELVTLAPEDALAHLHRATRRVLEEVQKQKLQTGRATRNVLDW